MPLIIACSDKADNLTKIEQLARQSELGVKAVLEPERALEWLEKSGCGLLLLDESLSHHWKSQLFYKLLEKSHSTHVLIFNTGTPETADPQILGIECTRGASVWERIETAIKNVKEDRESRGSAEHILVVEDLDSPRDIICMFLEGLGYPQVTGVNSARAALEELANSPGKYTCVLTDMRMPGMSGDELIRHIRRDSDTARLPVVVLTAFGTADCFVDCLKAGASGFLVKPPKKKDLLRELQRAEMIRRTGGAARLAQEQDAEALQKLLLERGYLE